MTKRRRKEPRLERPRRRGPDLAVQGAIDTAQREAIERAKARPVNPAVSAVKKPGEAWRFRSPHSKVNDWLVHIADTFGTRSESVIYTLLEQLAELTMPDWEPDDIQLNAALAIITDADPKNTLEAMFVAQMVAIHWLTMRSAAKGMHYYDPTSKGMTSKLARTFAEQTLTLHKIKGRVAPQQINVSYERHEHRHQHVHHHYSDDDGRRTDSGAGNWPTPLDQQAISSEGRAALPGPDPEDRVAMPAPSLPREEAVLTPRRAVDGDERGGAPSVQARCVHQGGAGVQAGGVADSEGVEATEEGAGV